MNGVAEVVAVEHDGQHSGRDRVSECRAVVVAARSQQGYGGMTAADESALPQRQINRITDTCIPEQKDAGITLFCPDWEDSTSPIHTQVHD